MRFADLHTHTYFSDGLRSPQELIETAHAHRIGIVSISDHDTTEALEHARPVADRLDVTLITGVELSVSWRGRDVHLLGYAFSPEDETVETKLAEFREVRDERGQAIARRLAELDVPIDLDRLREICGQGAVGRPHLALALVEAGHCSSVDDAFDRYLAEGRPAFVPKMRFSAAEGIEMIHAAGGLVSLAHPVFYDEPILLIEELIELGLDGIETLHPKITPEWKRKLDEVCRHRGLMVTGGSDDHGFEEKRTLGQIRLPETEIGPILERISPVT